MLDQSFRVTLKLSPSEADELARRARLECRPMRDHARYLVLRALGLLDDPAAPQMGEARQADASTLAAGGRLEC